MNKINKVVQTVIENTEFLEILADLVLAKRDIAIANADLGLENEDTKDMLEAAEDECHLAEHCLLQRLDRIITPLVEIKP
jgi:hypothetical protein